MIADVIVTADEVIAVVTESMKWNKAKSPVSTTSAVIYR
jgi:hypothetical protein